MNKITLCILCAFIYLISNAQDSACTDICSRNLSVPAYNTFKTTPPISYAKDAATPDYHDVTYRLDGNNILRLCYSSTNKCDTTKDALVYKVIYPDSNNYSTCPLPCVIVAHGGFFSDCSEYSLILDLCQQLAKRGFVVFNVEYRRGSILPASSIYTSVQQMLAIYRACQDVRGAIRSIIKRAANADVYNDPWRIDTNSIFLAGESAGSIAMLNAAYYTPEMTYKIYPKVKGSVSIAEALGPLDEDFYYGEPSIDYLPHIKGIYGQSTGVFIPINFFSKPASFFPSNTPKIPAILFHGNQDSVFDVNSQPVYFYPKDSKPDSQQVDLNSETLCLNAGPFKVNGSAQSADLLSAGAMGIYNYLLKPLGIKSEIYVDCQMYHNLDNNSPAFSSDFGTGLTKHDAVINYEASRAATFFQAILSGTVNNLRKNIFVECENLRTGCNATDNYSVGGCTNCNANDGGKCDISRLQTQLISAR